MVVRDATTGLRVLLVQMRTPFRFAGRSYSGNGQFWLWLGTHRAVVKTSAVQQWAKISSGISGTVPAPPS